MQKESKNKNINLLKQMLVSTRDFFIRIGKDTAVKRELLFYLPVFTVLTFFYFTNNLSYAYHTFGNYGFEENFLSETVPLVNKIADKDFSTLTVGLNGFLYPAVLAFQKFAFGGDILRNALFINVVFSSLSLLMFFFLVKRIGNSTTAVLSMILLAVNPVFFEFTYTASAAPLLIFLLLAAALSFSKHMETSSNYHMCTAAIFSVFACLTNFTSIIFPVAAFLLLLKQGRIGKLILFAIIFLTISIFTVLALKLQLGDIAGQISIDGTVGNMVITYAKRAYFLVFRMIEDLTGWFLGIFALLAIIVTVIVGEKKRGLLIWYSCGFAFFLITALFNYNRHQIVYMLLFLLPLTIRLFSGSLSSLLNKKATFAVSLMFASALLIYLTGSLQTNGKTAKGEPRHLIPIAKHIKQIANSNEKILSIHSLFAARIGLSHVPIREKIENWQQLIDYANENGCDYFLADFPEYNTMPFLRFLANEEITRPKGAIQIARNGYSALYRFTGISHQPNTPYIYDEYFAINNVINPMSADSAARFIANTLSKKSEIEMPEFQIISERNGNGFVRYGFVYKSRSGALVSANFLSPPKGVVGLNTSPAVLILPGNEITGKASLLSRNISENLARSGAHVITIDQPGTGERVGVQYSHSAIMQNYAAVGKIPADLFVSEALEAASLFSSFSGVHTDTFSIIGIGDASWTALYMSILTKTIRSLVCIGGLAPYSALATLESRPIQALVPAIAGAFKTDSVFKASYASSQILLSSSHEQNAFYDVLGKIKPAIIIPYSSAEDFTKTAFPLLMKTMQSGLSLQESELSFSYSGDSAMAECGTIGSEQVSFYTPLLFDIREIPLRNTTISNIQLFSDKTHNGVNSLLHFAVNSNNKTTMPSESANLFDTAVSIVDGNNYKSCMNLLYNEIISQSGDTALLIKRINRIGKSKNRAISIYASDTISAHAAIAIAATTKGLLANILLHAIPDGRLANLLTTPLSGYDGIPYFYSNMEDINNLAVCKLLHYIGNVDASDLIIKAAENGTRIFVLDIVEIDMSVYGKFIIPVKNMDEFIAFCGKPR